MASIPITSELAGRALDSAPDGILIVDEEGRIRFANQQVTALFGYPPEVLTGQPIEVLIPERLRVTHVTHRRTFSQGPRARPMGLGLDLFGRRRDGSEFPVEISLSPIADKGSTLIAAAIRNVTDQKAVQAELIKARQAAERASQAAERASQAKSRFLATASHDLRQPLQTLALLNGTLHRMLSHSDAAEALVRQEQAISAMSRLLNALLDISKLESGAVRPDPTDFAVAALFDELREEFAGLAASKGLELRVEPCTACVHSDPSLIGQILRNLLSNAIKYTHRGWVRLCCLQEAAQVRIEVLDTGIGIPADQLANIYDEFYQVGGAGRVREGYGLGLSIVQRLVKLLSLELHVHSELGSGSVFSLVLPVGARTSMSVAAIGECLAPGRTGAPARHVLLVEDDAGVRAATRMLLQVEGYKVTAVGSLREALDAVRNQTQLDVLISDYHLGEAETGLEVISQIRETLRSPIKAMLMTGDTSSSIRHIPSDAYLRIINKPIAADQFVKLLASFVASEPVV